MRGSHCGSKLVCAFTTSRGPSHTQFCIQLPGPFSVCPPPRTSQYRYPQLLTNDLRSLLYYQSHMLRIPEDPAIRSNGRSAISVYLSLSTHLFARLRKSGKLINPAKLARILQRLNPSHRQVLLSPEIRRHL